MTIFSSSCVLDHAERVAFEGPELTDDNYDEIIVSLKNRLRL